MEDKTSDTGSFESLKRILEQHQAAMPKAGESTALAMGDFFARLQHFGPDEGDPELLMPPRNCDGTLRQLRADQRQAIESILKGATYERAAEDAGVDRRTLYRWMNKDSAFSLALENQRLRMVEQAEDRLVSSAQMAAGTLCQAAAKGNIAAASNVLKLVIQFQRKAGDARKVREKLPTGVPRQFQMRLREMLLSLTADCEPQANNQEQAPALPAVITAPSEAAPVQKALPAAPSDEKK